MLAFNFGVLFLYIILFGEETTQVHSVQVRHATLFFSGPLEEKLGVYEDQKKVTLTCNGGSKNPQPGTSNLVTYKWLRNGRELITYTGNSRVIATVQGDLIIYPSQYDKDDGNYQCRITDATPEKWSLLSNTAELSLAYVTGVPRKDLVTSTGELGKGWKYIFSGYSHSKYPKPKFIWKFKGAILKETDKRSISEDGNLYIAQLSYNDAGTYSFELESKSLKQKRESVKLQIIGSTSSSDILATFLLVPKNKRVSLKRDKEVTFECFVTGRPMPTITWKKDGRKLYDSHKYDIKDFNKRLTIRDLSTSDSGKYQCTITRAAVKSVSQAILTVIAPPTIESIQPQDQIGHIGNYTIVTCIVKGSFIGVHFSFSWYRNGVKLSPTSRIFMRKWSYPHLQKHTLNVTRLLKVPDGGMYQCFATNDGGEDMKYTAIDVQSLPPNITFGPGIVYAVLGRPAKIICIVTGSPPMTFTWEKAGRRISDGKNGNNFTYVIDKVQRSDVSQYTCIAKNGPDPNIDVAKSTGRLEIVGETVVVNRSSKVYAPKGSHPYLYCGVRYDPKVNVTYRWYFKNQLIKTDGAREVTWNGRLIIKGVHKKVGGIYRCESRSAVGDYSTTIELIVQSPPFKTTIPRVDKDNIRPDSVSLQWRAGYDGESAIQYFSIGIKYANGTTAVYIERAMPSGDIKTYVVPGLTPSTEYQFAIQAWNSVGKSEWSGWSSTIKTHEAPPSYKLKKVTGSAVNDDTIEVKWEEPPKSTHNGILRGYYVAWKYAGVTSGRFTTREVTPATTRVLRITHLILNSPYEVKVQMFNDAGAGPYSEPTIIRTKEGIPSSAPRDFAVRNVSSRSVVLEWNSPPQQDWNGDLKSYIIRLWVFDHEDDVYQRNAVHDKSAFIQVFNVTKLKTYTQYEFKISAHNSVGGGPEAGPIGVKTTEDAPSAPQRLSIVEQFSDTISVSWVRPREVNGVLTGYVVKYWRVGHKNEEKVEKVPGYELQAGITSLRSNTRYMIVVAAKTRAGESKSASIEGRTLDIPVHPTAPSALRFLEINATAIELTWKEGSKGRSPIIKYVIEGNNETGFANDKTSTWFDALIIKDPFKKYNVPPVIIEDLRPAMTYRFRVRAYNKVGSSPLSSISSDVKTANAAPWSPPLNVKVHSDDLNAGELQLTWELPPKETWNSPYISYAVELQEVGPESEYKQNRTASGIFRELKAYKITSLKKFTTYRIRMRTVSQYGESPFSPSIIGQTSEYVPDVAPDDIRAIGFSGSSIKITWDEVPKEGGNGAVLGYKLFYRLVQYSPQRYKEINVGNVRSYVLKNLIGYTQYDIRLLAFTKIGDGKRSDALRPYPRTLETIPGPPSRLRFPTIDASLVAVSWDIPELVGGNITMYRVSHKPRDEVGARLIRSSTLASTERAYTVTSLSADKFYIFEVQARTSVGWGDAARATVFTSRSGSKGKAETPLILPISDSNITSRSVAIRWAVVTRRQQPIRFFTLQYRKGEGAWITHLKPLNGDERKLVVWGLEPNHMYTFRISSTIDAHISPFSTPSPPVRTLRESIGGSPRNVRITSNSSTTLIVEWEPPFLVETQATVFGYRLGYELHRTSNLQVANYSDRILSASYRKYMFTGLKEFTLYDLRLNAIDENRRNMRSYEETRRTAARLPPAPSLGRSPSVGQTSVIIYWDKPSSTHTSIMGYKAVYENPKRRRRRRAVSEYCDTAEPGEAYFSNKSTKGTITNLAMYTSYRIVLHSFNSAGDSKGSNAVYVETKEGVPGPPEKFSFDGVYGNEVHLYWEPPCERNGVLKGYKLTVSANARGKIQEKNLDSDVGGYKVLGLAILTRYKFELVARTSQGAGFPKILETQTGGPPVLPEPPKNIRGRAENNDVTLVWKDGFHGNIPILKYMIQYRTSERTPWVVGWTLDPSDINKNRTDGTVWVVLEDLKPVTSYWFRIVVQNKLGKSSPSDQSNSVLTGEALPVPDESPIYEKIWFIAVMAVLGFLILILLIVCIVLVCRRSRRGSKRIAHPALEMNIQPSQGLRHYSSFEGSLSNGGPKSKDEKHLVDESEEEEEVEDDDEEQASSLETKSDESENESEDDIPTKKRQIKAALQEQDKYYPHSKPPRSFSSDNVHGSPPPAYATYASRRMNARSEPFLDPFNEFNDDDDKALRGYQSPFDRPPTRRSPRSASSPYDDDSSDSSEIQKRKRGDPRSSSFRRALISGKPEPEPERPIENGREPERRPKPTPRKYRSLEKAVNDSAKPPSYEYDDDDDDIDVRVRQPGMSQRFSLPPEYRSDSGRDSSDDHDRVPLNQRFDPPERSESPAPAYHSSTDDSLDNPDRQRLVESNPRPEPEISSYSSFV